MEESNKVKEKKKIRKRIIEFLKKQDKSINLSMLSRELKISYPTILKYCDILEEADIIEVENFGNVKVIKIKKECE